ncbi:MAG: hypothetical protein CL819_15325, partial [Croceicoccus sp.]|nr:hypothetical protein [Croceicoccus sp.]
DAEQSALHADPAVALGWINGQHDLRKFVIPPTSEQMVAIIEGRAMGPQAVTQDGGGSTGGTRARSAGSLPPAEPETNEESADDYIDAGGVDDDELQF